MFGLIFQIPMRRKDSLCGPATLKQDGLSPVNDTGYRFRGICLKPSDKYDFIIHSLSVAPKHCHKSLSLMGLEVQAYNSLTGKEEDEGSKF